MDDMSDNSESNVIMKNKEGTPLSDTSDDNEKFYKCNICSKVYKSLGGLTGHLRSVHEGELSTSV